MTRYLWRQEGLERQPLEHTTANTHPFSSTKTLKEDTVYGLVIGADCCLKRSIALVRLLEANASQFG